jgi:zinc ribbon protein
VFCPNCGTQNDSGATPCKKCGFKLSGISAPKFKGTMMLNTDQTVQDLIEEYKKKAQGGAADSAPPTPGSEPKRPEPTPVRSSVAPLSELPGAPKGVFQPPRVAASRRRMGGTMLGVAPQVGGVTPPLAELAATPELEGRPTPLPATPRRSSSFPDAQPTPPRGADGLAGTVAMPVVASGVARTIALPATPESPELDRAESDRAESDEDLLASDAAAALTEPSEFSSTPASPTAAMPLAAKQPGAGDDSELAQRAQRLRPFEVVLVVLTCGLYGIYLLLRRRQTH